MDLKEKKLSGEVLYSGKVVRLEKDRVLCPNGITSYREIIRHPGGAAILCITKDRQVLLIKQYRYAYDDFYMKYRPESWKSEKIRKKRR